VREVITLPLASSTWWRSTPSAKRCSATEHRHRVEQTSGSQYIMGTANAADIGTEVVVASIANPAARAVPSPLPPRSHDQDGENGEP
jgi:hypothetical protein